MVNAQLIARLHLETTTACNLRCRHCRVSCEPEYRHEHMPAAVWAQCLDAMRACRPVVILHGHGEPLFDPLWAERLRAAETHSSGYEWQTNGQLLDPELLRRYFADCRKWKQLKVSVDALGEQYEHLRRGALWDRLDANMRAFASLRKGRKPLLVIEAVLLRSLRSGIPALAQYVREEWNADVLQVSRFFPRGELASEACGTVPPETRATCERIGLSLRMVGVTVEGETPKHAKTPRTCKKPWELLFVRVDGRCQVCCFNGRIVGDLSCQTWREVWNGKELAALRAEVPMKCISRCVLFH